MVTNKSSQLRIIAGLWRGRKITFIDQQDLRPTPDRVRETVFNWLQSDIPNAVCLDLFAGSGALGFESASRGAKQVTLVDNSSQVCQQIQENIKHLQSEVIRVITSDALRFLEENTTKYDLVFLDPPYKSDVLAQIVMSLEQKKCLSEHAKIYLEHDVKQDVPELPENWRVLKNKTAGQVSYYLIDRIEPERK